jgi:precorrin-6Y C5,15-methyltransferase (decarboxylating)
MTEVHIVGIGLDGASGLNEKVRQIVAAASLLIGSDRHLNYFPNHPAKRLSIQNFTETIAEIRHYLKDDSGSIVVLVSGDPLFFGLGRLLAAELPREKLTFHPHLSSVQLAFNRIKVSWQDAKVISAHGRSLDNLISALQQGVEKIAVLTDGTNSPGAIARLLSSLDNLYQYQMWVCENLGGDDERVQCFDGETLSDVASNLSGFAPLNVVLLLRQENQKDLDLAALPLFGICDDNFLSFSDRPGLMTKREVRTLVLAELALQPGQIIWDIGAGTGSVSIEIARLSPSSTVYAIEKTAAGHSLISRNCERFGVTNIIPVRGSAPDVLHDLPACERVFIGGSGGNLTAILDTCATKLNPGGAIVLALATVEHLHTALLWFKSQGWEYHHLQVQLSRSVPVGELTRLAPLNPVTIVRGGRG